MPSSGSKTPAESPALGLTPAQRQRALRLSRWEGFFWALMVGCGETYFVADGVRLGASSVALALLVTLPLLTGASGPLLALSFGFRLPARKIGVAIAAISQAMLLGGLAVLELAGSMTPTILIVASCLYQVCGLGASTLWASWFGDLVPAENRGSYFGGRNRIVQTGILIGLVASGATLQLLEPNAPGVAASAAGAGGIGFAAIFGFGALMRLVSSVLVIVTPESRRQRPSTIKQSLRFLRTDRGKVAIRILFVAGALQLGTYVAAPFFTPFMLRDLGFSYLELMLATMTVILAKIAFLPAFGRLIDLHGPRVVFGIALVVVAIVPIPWLLARGLPLVLVAQAMSGFAWACHEVSYFALLLDTSSRRIRPALFAAQNLVNGPAQIGGGMLGAQLLALVGHETRVLFAISAVLRLIAATVIFSLVPRSTRGAEPRRRDLVLRMVGFRTDGGIALRPMPVREDSGEDTQSRLETDNDVAT